MSERVAVLAGIAAGILVGIAVALGDPRGAARERLTGLLPPTTNRRRRPESAADNGRRAKAWSAALAGCFVALLVGPPAGLVAGPAVAGALWHWFARLEPRDVRLTRERMHADLPLAVELLATSLAAGAVPLTAVRQVAGAVEGPLGRRLASVAETIELGVEPAAVWELLSNDPVLGPVARTLARSAHAGVPAAPALQRTAANLRGSRRAAAEAAAQAVAIKAIAPIGLCYLPAFVLLGIVPTIWGLGRQALGTG